MLTDDGTFVVGSSKGMDDADKATERLGPSLGRVETEGHLEGCMDRRQEGRRMGRLSIIADPPVSSHH